ncbi:Aste57867_24338 [Aphanomyces stellatus]|uniref:Aste57867_24338 protein n=1 Tax=Aphanomyces stellatus TaxID=120398 RepID=A0A485LQ66_9STRA|nr:hypothetical protein As57867_024263 [Aphanomyces stellatus]VFU00978.1 Aste57867_24338 [Aphanomyces stellatus]
MVTTRRGTKLVEQPPTPRKAAAKKKEGEANTVAESAASAPAAAKDNSDDDDDLELVHLMVLFRHGDRSPITTQVGEHLVMDEKEKELWASKLPSDEHIDTLSKGAKVTGMETHLPPPKAPRDGGVFPNGQLTIRGLEQMEAKGKGLREHYTAFLTDIHERDVFIRSTNVRRTIRSCLSLLHGAFPELIGDDRLHIRINHDVTLEPTFTQADYGTLLARYKEPARQGSLPPLPATVGCTTSLDADIRKVIGIPDDKSICYTSLREVLVCRNAHDVPFPAGMDKAMYNKLVDYNTWEFHTLFGDATDCYNGFYKGVDEVFALLHGVTTAGRTQKVSLLAVHDSTLIALWNAMRLDSGVVFPVYAALTAIELYKSKSSGRWFVKVKIDHAPVHFKDHKHSLTTPFAHLEKIVHVFLKKAEKRVADEDAAVDPVPKKAKTTE